MRISLRDRFRHFGARDGYLHQTVLEVAEDDRLRAGDLRRDLFLESCARGAGQKIPRLAVRGKKSALLQIWSRHCQKSHGMGVFLIWVIHRRRYHPPGLSVSCLICL